ncbi:MAG: hypothetical protein CHACPFDD_01709 [Phycisphaerae bacterium]|nr:hypothetical protein [Phycisphaerae bacterium]
MIDAWFPAALFNPATARQPLSALELLAGPLGIIAFVPLAPLLRAYAARAVRTSLLAFALAWLVLTTGPRSALVLVAGALGGAGAVALIGAARRRGWLTPRGATAATWIGLHALCLPLWWNAHALTYGWQPARMAPLHAMGFSYLLLRLLAWGVDLARRPAQTLRPVETLCWLLYPPCLRNGPVMRRDEFLEKLDHWQPGQPTAWRAVLPRLTGATLGLAALMVAAHNTPRSLADGVDFFNSPQLYPTRQLLRAIILIPVQIYLFLWSYNELAAGVSHWVGIPVRDNFDRLPLATSVREFWRRWHTTVGAWLRDLIYIPIGGSRRWPLLSYLGAFGYCGVWHGASWSFVGWGTLQALALEMQRLWERWRGDPVAREAAPRADKRSAPPGFAAALLTVVAWLATMTWGILTIYMFADFNHFGLRTFAELARRIMPS